jgi:hypothetical protein
MAWRELERLSGRGRVWLNGIMVGGASYVVTVSQQEHLARTLGSEQCLRRIQGRLVQVDPGVNLFTLSNEESITLELEDGRRWDCGLEDGDGRLVNTLRDDFYKS